MREELCPTVAVGGDKANVGHAEPAAGLTGLVRLAVCLSRGQAPANALLRVINPHVNEVFQELDEGENIGWVLPIQLSQMGANELEQGRGGVSSFGYAGTLAHTVLARSQGMSDLDAAAGIQSTWSIADWSNQPSMLHRRMAFPWYTAAAAAAATSWRSTSGAFRRG